MPATTPTSLRFTSVRLWWPHLEDWPLLYSDLTGLPLGINWTSEHSAWSHEMLQPSIPDSHTG